MLIYYKYRSLKLTITSLIVVTFCEHSKLPILSAHDSQ